MQKTKIEWTDYVWNPVTGCHHGCQYCYARKLAYRLKGRCGYPIDEPFRPTFHEERMEDLPDHNPGMCNGKKIFVSSMGDLFGKWVPEEWINRVLLTVRAHPSATFIFLTKNPQRYSEFNFPKNAWIGYSTTGPLFHEWDSKHKDNIKFISIEPMMGDIMNFAYLRNTDWVIIGTESGNRKGKVKFDNQWLRDALIVLDKLKIPVFIKNNAGGSKQEYPMDPQETVQP